MKSATILCTVLATASQCLANSHHLHHNVARLLRTTPEPATAGSYTFQGCYSSKANMTAATAQNPTTLSCYTACKSSWVFALQGEACYCGSAYPSDDDKGKPSECSTPCSYFPQEACGGPNVYSVFNTGVNLDPPIYSDKKSKTTSSAKHTSSSPSQTESSEPESTAVRTAVVTHTESSSSGDSSKDNGSSSGSGGKKQNVAGIAAGVVVGVVAAAALIGGIVFWMRRKRNAEIEEEHRRNAAVNAFISGSKPPGSAGGISMTDSRLDPVMAHRRLSDGSIADNQDYSRRILRVTNA